MNPFINPLAGLRMPSSLLFMVTYGADRTSRESTLGGDAEKFLSASAIVNGAIIEVSQIRQDLARYMEQVKAASQRELIQYYRAETQTPAGRELIQCRLASEVARYYAAVAEAKVRIESAVNAASTLGITKLPKILTEEFPPFDLEEVFEALRANAEHKVALENYDAESERLAQQLRKDRAAQREGLTSHPEKAPANAGTAAVAP